MNREDRICGRGAFLGAMMRANTGSGSKRPAPSVWAGRGPPATGRDEGDRRGPRPHTLPGLTGKAGNTRSPGTVSARRPGHEHMKWRSCCGKGSEAPIVYGIVP